ncbi:MAG: sensor histidine kinase [Acidimicrobiales bacterium]
MTAVAFLAVAAVLAATSATLLVVQRRLLLDHLDEGLRAHHERVLEDPSRVPLPGLGDDDAFAQVVDPAGSVRAATANFEGARPLPGPEGRERFWSARLGADRERVRVLSRREGELVVHTAAPLDDVDESLAALRTGLAVAAPAVALLLALLIWRLVGRTLAPVEAIRTRVAAIDADHLHERAPVPPTGDEVARLALTMNAMLDRVETAVEAQRRFVADASHELRTPLARMRAELEVDLAHPATADPARTLHSVLEEVTGLAQLVEELLALARLDAVVAAASTRRRVDLAEVVAGETARPPARSEVTVTTIASPVEVRGDPGQLARAVRNVLDNALRHAAGRVAITVHARGDQAELTVADDGPGIPPAAREAVFERFTRLDQARGGSGGAGLGLAIALGVARAHGGAIRIDTAELGGALVTLTLPLAEAGAGRAP